MCAAVFVAQVVLYQLEFCIKFNVADIESNVSKSVSSHPHNIGKNGFEALHVLRFLSITVGHHSEELVKRG